MPATLAINPAGTFSACVFMGCAPKYKFQTTEQDRTQEGRPKWEVQCAVTYLAEPGQRAFTEGLAVTVVADRDPSEGLTAPCTVELVDLRAGVSTPEAKEGGRVRGGRLWWQASALRQVPAHVRKADQAA